MVTLTLPPSGAVFLARDESIQSMDAPFAWSSTVQARTVHLANGIRIVVLDTADNVTAVRQALLGISGSVTPTTPPMLIGQKRSS